MKDMESIINTLNNEGVAVLLNQNEEYPEGYKPTDKDFEHTAVDLINAVSTASVDPRNTVAFKFAGLVTHDLLVKLNKTQVVLNKSIEQAF